MSQAGFGFEATEVEEIKTAGGYVIGNNTALNAIILGEVTTTYKTDNAGNPDISYKYLNYVDTISQAREYMFNNAKKDFAQSRLTEGDVYSGRSMANKGSIETAFIRYFGTLGGEDYVLAQSGEAARKYFKDNLSITLDLKTGDVLASMKLPIVTQFRTLVANIQISFSVND
jgi:hypothetical protein